MSASAASKAKFAAVQFVSREAHYSRVNDLLEGNNRLLERARKAEHAIAVEDARRMRLIEKLAAANNRVRLLEGELVESQDRLTAYLEEDHHKSWWQRFKERHIVSEVPDGYPL